MRVSDGMITANMVYRVQQSSERLFRVQEQAASGLRFTRPSQDPTAAVRAAALRSNLSELGQYLQNASTADARLRLTEVAVAEMSDVLAEVRTIALAGLNDSLDEAARAGLAAQVAEFSEVIMRAGNYEDGSRYLLAGSKLLTPPLVDNPTPPPPVLYQGDQAELSLQVGRGISVVSNLDDAALLNLNGAADPATNDVFTDLENLQAAILANDHDALEGAVTAMDAHFWRVNSLRGEIGARLVRLDFDRRRLEEAEYTSLTLLGETEGADLAEVIARLEERQVAYQAAVAACSLLTRAGLLDYLR